MGGLDGQVESIGEDLGLRQHLIPATTALRTTERRIFARRITQAVLQLNLAQVLHGLVIGT